MRILKNAGNDRIVDLVRPLIGSDCRFDMVTPALSIFACEPLLDGLRRSASCRFVLPADVSNLTLLGAPADRASRNRLQSRWLASQVRDWLTDKAEIRFARAAVPQGALVVRDKLSQPAQALLGALALTTDGVGLTPGNPLKPCC
jgi:hypothetical protein